VSSVKKMATPVTSALGAASLPDRTFSRRVDGFKNAGFVRERRIEVQQIGLLSCGRISRRQAGFRTQISDNKSLDFLSGFDLKIKSGFKRASPDGNRGFRCRIQAPDTKASRIF